ncbi:unnamed protein product, partial [Amoebophrya sp. A120]
VAIDPIRDGPTFVTVRTPAKSTPIPPVQLHEPRLPHLRPVVGRDGVVHQFESGNQAVDFPGVDSPRAVFP